MSHKLEITVLSAEDLGVNRKHVKKNVFVCLQSSESGRSEETWTMGMETEGSGSHPKWNEKVEMEVPVHARFITAEVKEKSSMGGVTSIGMARIPVSDFMGGYVPENQVQFLSYRLWDKKCRKNGIINVSVRVKASEHTHRHISKFIFSHPSLLMVIPPYYYGQSPQHHIMNNLNLMTVPPCYYAPPLYLKSSCIQRTLPPEDPELYPKIVKQIEYYFSEENLVKDTYLKNKMEQYGWIDVSVIANFRRIKALTDNIHHILEALVFSSVVQVRGYKMRVRDGWKKWINPQILSPNSL